ncbi:MAG: hypothetical protein AB1797_13520 [bacterium]
MSYYLRFPSNIIIGKKGRNLYLNIIVTTSAFSLQSIHPSRYFPRNRSSHDAGCSMLDPRCSIFDAGKGSSIQDRASRIEDRGCCALVAERLLFR